MSFPDDDSNASFGNHTKEFVNYTMTDFFVEEIAYVLNVYFTPALIIMGVIGNLLSLIVFFKSKLRGQSTSQYLSALAISDTIFLIQLIPPWLKAVRLSLVFSRFGYCQTFVYFTYVSSADSTWLVVAFTIERFVAVLYPLRRTRMCTVRRARIIILAIAFCCLAINIPVLKFAVPRENDCNIDHELMDHAARFNVIDTILSFTLPLTIITVLNIWIMIGVCRVSRARGQLMRDERPADRQAHRGHRLRRTSLQHSQHRITRMLLIVSTVFVVLNLPAYSMRIVAYAKNMSSYEYSGRWAALQQICLSFFNANFGINFFLYCMTGQNFRRALCQTFPCLNRARRLLKRLCCCCCGEKDDPQPRPSYSNSISTNTEARARVSSSWWRHDSSGRGYLQLWRFDNSRQRRQRLNYELKPYPMYQISRPQFPEEPFEVMNPALPKYMRRTDQYGFYPIPYNLVPGQVAPLTIFYFIPPTPTLDPSPSPLLIYRPQPAFFVQPVYAITAEDEHYIYRLDRFAITPARINYRPQLEMPIARVRSISLSEIVVSRASLLVHSASLPLLTSQQLPLLASQQPPRRMCLEQAPCRVCQERAQRRAIQEQAPAGPPRPSSTLPRPVPI